MANTVINGGVSNDTLKLTLQEKLTLPAASSTRQVQPAGSIIYDNLSLSDPRLFYSDGIQWRELGIGLTSDIVTEPVDPPGTVIYNEGDQNLYYSNGVAWVVIDSGGVNQNLEDTLTNGNTTGANNIIVSDGGNEIQGEDELVLRALDANASLISDTNNVLVTGETGVTVLANTGDAVLQADTDRAIVESVNDVVDIRAADGITIATTGGEIAINSTGAGNTVSINTGPSGTLQIFPVNNSVDIGLQSPGSNVPAPPIDAREAGVIDFILPAGPSTGSIDVTSEVVTKVDSLVFWNFEIEYDAAPTVTVFISGKVEAPGLCRIYWNHTDGGAPAVRAKYFVIDP